MRVVLFAVSAVALAGCVQPEPYPAGPYPLQAPVPYPYRMEPVYRPPMPAPQNEPTPLLPPGGQDTRAPDQRGPEDGPTGSGAIPLQDLPAPAPEGTTPASPDAGAAATPAPRSAPSRMPSASSPVAGRGSNVPLEGFRPMHSQSAPTP